MKDEKIPKIIHYCWFGGNPKPESVNKYIRTWEKHCPEYKIIEWNESNFDLNENIYCQEAYEAQKWAFITDYVRLKVLYEYGGFYMDTDVEMIKSLDPLRIYRAVSGYESPTRILTGTIGSCRDNEWIGLLLRYYDNRHFLREDGTFDLTTNVKVITEMTSQKYNLSLDGKKKKFGTNMILLPFDYLCAKDLDTGEVKITENTFTVHHFSGSWLSDEDRYANQLKSEIAYILPKKYSSYLAKYISVIKYHGIIYANKQIIAWLQRKKKD